MTLKFGFGSLKVIESCNVRSADSENPHIKTKHHVDRQTGCEVIAIFVYPRWPPAAILDFIEPQIAPFDPLDPENLSIETNMEWIGCTICEIFAFKLYCDLETRVLGHSRSSKTAPFDSTYDFIFVFHSNYASIYTVSEI